MIVQVREWVGTRSLREQRLLLLMAAIALPLLLWLLVVRPVAAAYDAALERHLEAVDRNGRVRALAAAEGRTVSGASSTADLALVIAERAAQSGLTLDSNSASGPNDVSIVISEGQTIATTQWLAQLEREGFQVADLRMTPTAGGNVAVTARLVRTVR